MVETLVRPIEIGEILSASQEMAGAQGRMLYAFQGALNEDFHIPNKLRNPQKQFASFEDRDYSPYERTLHKRREEYWNGRTENTLDERYSAWEADLINWSQNEDESRWVLEKLDGFFNSIGVQNVRDHGLDSQKLAIFYDRYFRLPKDENGNDIPLEQLDGKEKRGLKLFIEDNIKAVTKPDGSIDFDEWHRIEDAAMKLSEVFGEPPADFKKNVSMNLVEAELKFKDNPQQFVELQGNDKRLSKDNLTDDEKALLNEIKEKGELPKILPFDLEANRKKLLNKIRKFSRVNVEAGTGTGKTTRIGPMVYEDLMGPDDKFLCSQPFKLNASTTAGQIAKMLGVEVGEEVAWIHGDDKSPRNFSKEKILVLTEGTAVHLIQDMDETALNKVVGNDRGTLYFMVDEVHKLTKEGVELSFALMKLQEKFPDRVKLIFATATADSERFQQKLKIPTDPLNPDNDANMKVEGQAYDIHPHWAEQPGRPSLNDVIRMRGNERNDRVATDVMSTFNTILQTGKAKNVMVALPGLGEIKTVSERINALKEDPANKDNYYLQNLNVVWIHGGSTEEERKAISENEKVPPYSIYLCTPAAETGVTFPNLTHGIGSGMVRHTFYNPELGINELKLVPTSQAELTQMRGRLGRLEEGDFYYLYLNEQEYDNLPNFPTPQTERSDLVDVLLDFKRMGENDLSQVDALTDFPPNEVKSALITAKRLGIIDEDGNFTAAGKEMAGISTDYHFARAIVEGKGKGYAESLITIASIMEAIKGQLFVPLEEGNMDAQKQTMLQKRKELVAKVGMGDPALGVPPVLNSDFMVLLKLWREYEDVIIPIIGTKIVYDKEAFSEDKQQQLVKARQQFCDMYGLSLSAMKSIEDKQQKLVKRVILNGENANRGHWSQDVRNQQGIGKAMSVGFEDRRMKKIDDHYELVHNPQSEDDNGWTSPPINISTKNNPINPVVLPNNPENDEIIGYNINRIENSDGSTKIYVSYNQQYMAA
jgi:HrpA-like RNA helicase